MTKKPKPKATSKKKKKPRPVPLTGGGLQGGLLTGPGNGLGR
jgi:hypothetical protein